MSRLSKRGQSNPPVIISFQTPTSQMSHRIRSERGFYQIDQTPTTNYSQVAKTRPEKNKLDVAVTLEKMAIDSDNSDKKSLSEKICEHIEQIVKSDENIEKINIEPTNKGALK